MKNILQTTPLGGRKTVSSKLIICGGGAVMVVLLSLFPRFVVMVRDYWFSVPLAPLFSLDQYFAASQDIPILFLIVGMVVVRAAGVLCMMAVVLAISEKAGNTVVSTVLSSVLFCLAPILALAGIEGTKWMGAFPLFHFAAMVSQPSDGVAAWLYLLLWGMVGGLCVYYLYNRYPKD